MKTKKKSKMVIVKLKGGMGNQLFQYAAARRLAFLNNVPLKLDTILGYEFDDHGREYCLNHFNIVENIASLDEIYRIIKKNWIFKKVLRYTERKFKSYSKRSYIAERYNYFDPGILNLRIKKSVYFNGYWQSEKYFKDIENIIRREFTVKYNPDMINRTIMDEIANCNAVSIHVRRGDNVSHSASIKVYKVPALEYYHAAVKKISEKIKRPHFFIFSDDPKWVQKNMKLSYLTTFVTHNGDKKNYEDLRLMSLCKHHIIANSSFSWWGAWLSMDLNKIVITPNHWVKDLSLENKDMILKSWYRI